MAGTTEEKTCADKEAEEAERALELKECIQEGEFSMNFFAPGTVDDGDAYQKSVIEYMLCREVPEALRGNNAAMAKVCDNGHDGDPCACCRYECTGCDDEHECPVRTCGYGYAELARAAELVAGMAYIPISLYGKCWEDFDAGTVLVFDPKEMAENLPANPCEIRKAGAFVPKSIDQVVCEVLKEKGLI